MNYQALADRFWQEGYVAISDFFDCGLMDRYQRLILDHYGCQPQFQHTDEFLELSATEVVPWFPQADGVPDFDTVENDQRLLALTGAVLGQGWRSLYCMTMFSGPGSKGQAWHQDCAPEDARCFNLNRLLYTSDISTHTGGEVLVVPGSHLRGELTVGAVDEDFDDQVAISPSRGSLVLIHGHTWHRVRPVCGSSRVSINFRAVPRGTADNITDICVYRNMRYRFETGAVIENRLPGRDHH